MKFGALHKSVIVVLILLIMISGYCTLLLAQTNQKSKLESSKKSLESEITYTTNLLNETKKTRQASVNQVIILNNQIKKRELLINTIGSEVENIHGQINVNQVSVERLRSELQKLKIEYAGMINRAYRNHDGFSRLMFLFAAKDFNQAYQRLKYFQQFGQYRKNQINRILGTQEQINHKIKELTDQKSDKLSLLKNKETEKEKLTREKQEKTQTITQLQQKEKDLRKKLKEKEQALNKLKKAIEKIISDEIKSTAEAAKKSGATPAPSTGITMTPEQKELSNSFSANRGKLPWPAEKGILSSTFGEHDHPVLKGIRTRNNGVNILTSSGASARAVFSGTVTAIMSVPDLNNVVIVRHGDFLSVYSNLDQVFVKKGDKVKTKQSLGRIYSDREESKTELHFEIWNGKSLQDPMVWLAR
jgi:septal ring factor EnvC (AmiA/AmiB activator)